MKLFLGTAFVQALLNKNDNFHEIAKTLLPQFKNATEVWTTEAILTEIANALSITHRTAAVKFIQQCYVTPNMKIVAVDALLFQKALSLYQNRLDKTWGLTDCISFIVMKEQNITDAMTTDIHFIQAGFNALMRS